MSRLALPPTKLRSVPPRVLQFSERRVSLVPKPIDAWAELKMAASLLLWIALAGSALLLCVAEESVPTDVNPFIR